MEISSFDDLLIAARNQPEPQRLLFVFAKAVLPKDADEDERRGFQSGSGGGLQPLMSVDKRPESLVNFAGLVEEAREMGDDQWQFTFVSSLSGHGGEDPTAQATETAIDFMIKTIQGGGDITRFIAFNREGEPQQMSLKG